MLSKKPSWSGPRKSNEAMDTDSCEPRKNSSTVPSKILTGSCRSLALSFIARTVSASRSMHVIFSGRIPSGRYTSVTSCRARPGRQTTRASRKRSDVNSDSIVSLIFFLHARFVGLSYIDSIFGKITFTADSSVDVGSRRCGSVFSRGRTRDQLPCAWPARVAGPARRSRESSRPRSAARARWY